MKAEVGLMCFEDGEKLPEPRSADGLSKPEEARKRIPPTACSPADISTLGLLTPQNCKIINLCHFKPLELWQFVIAAIGNE